MTAPPPGDAEDEAEAPPPAWKRAVLVAAGLAVGAFCCWSRGPLGALPPTLAWLVGALMALPWVARGLDGLLPGALLRPAALAALEGAGLLVAFGSFFLLKIVGIHPSTTDENIYFYMATRFSQGAIPYRDFFFAHPPMHLVVPAAVFLATGFGVVTAKLIPVAAALLYGLFFYLALRRAAGRAAALAGLAGFLGAYQVLMASTDMTGVNITLAFLAAAAWCAVRASWGPAGLLAGLAVSTGMYAVAGAAGLALGALASSRRGLVKYLVALLATLGLVMGLFWVIGGDGFVEGVFVYHTRKPPKTAGWEDPLASWNPLHLGWALLHNLRLFLGGKACGQSLYYHAALYLACAAALAGLLGALAAAAWREGKKGAWRALRGALRPGSPAGYTLLCISTALLFLVQWGSLREVYDFYLVPMIFFVAVPFGLCVRACLLPARGPLPRRVLLAGPALLLLLWASRPLSLSLAGRLWPSEARDAGKTVTYEWREPAAFGSLARLTRALYFHGSRTVGELTPAYRHYVWNKSLSFSTAGEIARYVRDRTGSEATIAGASSVAPLVALLAGRRIAADEADTNAKRFKSGLLTAAAYFDEICRSPGFAYFVTAPRAYMNSQLVQGDPLASRALALETTFRDDEALFFTTMQVQLWRVREPGCGLAP